MAKLEDFLKDYFKIQRLDGFRNKSPLQWMTFGDWAKSGKLEGTATYSDWAKYLEKDAAGKYVSHNGLVVPRAIPTATDLSNDDWKKLYKICQNTWRKMNGERDRYESVVGDFIDDNAYLFTKSAGYTANADTENAITTMMAAVSNPAINGIMTANKYDYKNVFGVTRERLNEIATHVRNGGKKYNTDDDFRKDIQTIANTINYNQYVYSDVYKKIAPDFATWLTDKKIHNIYSEHLGWTQSDIDSSKLADFKTKYSKFLGTIQKDDKVFSAFQANEEAPQIITKTISEVKEKVDFDNDKNKVPEKSEDKLTFVEQVQKWAGDTYEDYFKKYEGLRGHRVFHHSTEVQAIVKAIDKAEIKPTDGLEKLVSSADGITSKLKLSNPAAGEAFEWFASTLKKISADPNMSKTFKGALKNGGQMRNLVAEIIKQAAKDGKPETERKAEIAMEVLMTIQYANTTSATLDYLADEKQKGLFTLLSDKDYSWNKNDGMKFITDAMDKTMRWAFLGVGRVGAILVNQWRKNVDRKFNGKYKNNTLRGAHQTWLSKTSSDRSKVNATHEADTSADPATQSELRKRHDSAVGDRSAAEGVLQGLGSTGLTGDDLLNDQDKQMATDEESLANAKSKLEMFEYVMQTIQHAISLKQDYERAVASGATAERDRLDMEIQNLDASMDTTSLGIPGFPTTLDLKTASYASLEANLATINSSTEYTNAVNTSHTIQDRMYERQENLDKLRKAIQQIETTEQRMQEHEKEYNEFDDKHQDMYTRLMSYWDTLQDGRWSGHIGSAKRFQNRHAEQLKLAIERNRANYRVH